MRVIRHALGLGLVLSLGVACAQATTACETGAAGCLLESAGLDQDIVLAAGKPVEVGPARVRLLFDRVVGDSRCPTDVQCVWAGNATSRLRVRVDSGLEQIVDLNTSVGDREARFNGYVLRLVSLSPDPMSTAAIAPGAYRVTVRLARQ